MAMGWKSARSEVKRLWIVLAVVLIAVAVLDPRLLLSVFWRVFVAAVAFGMAHLLWKSAFSYVDVRSMLENRDDELSDAVVLAGLCVLRAAVYGAVILGVLLNIGGP